MAMMGMGGDDKNEITQKELNGVMTALCQGHNVKWDNVPLNPKNRFYILGLAPNASRLSVRFFLRDSFGAFVQHYQKHQEGLNIVRPRLMSGRRFPCGRYCGRQLSEKPR